MADNQVNEMLGQLEKLEALRKPCLSEIPGLRDFDRFVLRGEAELQTVNPSHLDPEIISIHIRDVSLGGIGFVTSNQLKHKSLYRINFVASGYPVYQDHVIIRHCDFVQDGVYLAGAEFCANPALLVLLGADPNAVKAAVAVDDMGSPNDFIAPDHLEAA